MPHGSELAWLWTLDYTQLCELADHLSSRLAMATGAARPAVEELLGAIAAEIDVRDQKRAEECGAADHQSDVVTLDVDTLAVTGACRDGARAALSGELMLSAGESLL